jgi:hypothetical protein
MRASLIASCTIAGFRSPHRPAPYTVNPTTGHITQLKPPTSLPSAFIFSYIGLGTVIATLNRENSWTSLVVKK